QEGKLLEVYGPKHPDVQAVRSRLENVRRLILPATTPRGGRLGGPGADQDFVRMKTELFKQELHDLRVAEQSLGKLFEGEQKTASASFRHEMQEEAHRKGVERSRLLYESILHRLEELNSVRDFGGYDAQVTGPAQRGELAIKRYLLILGLGLFAGLLGGLAWAYAAEGSDRRLRTPPGGRNRLRPPG